MKRRGFLGLVGLSAPAAALAYDLPENSSEKGIVYKSTCRCGEKFEQFVDLTKPIWIPYQCPVCLSAIPADDNFSQQIKEWNVAHGRKPLIYTPKKWP